jgi:hypothetical protein
VTPYDAPRALCAHRVLLCRGGAAVLGRGSAVVLGGSPTRGLGAGRAAPVPSPGSRWSVSARRAGAWDAPLAVTVTDGELVSVRSRPPTRGAGQVADRDWRATGGGPRRAVRRPALVRDRNGSRRWVSGWRRAGGRADARAALSPGRRGGRRRRHAGRSCGSTPRCRTRRRARRWSSACRVPAPRRSTGAWRWIAAEAAALPAGAFWEPGHAISVVADLRPACRCPSGCGATACAPPTTPSVTRSPARSTSGAKTMTVRRDGEVPAGAQGPRWAGRSSPTRNGVHLVLEKDASKVLDSRDRGPAGRVHDRVRVGGAADLQRHLHALRAVVGAGPGRAQRQPRLHQPLPRRRRSGSTTWPSAATSSRWSAAAWPEAVRPRRRRTGTCPSRSGSGAEPGRRRPMTGSAHVPRHGHRRCCATAASRPHRPELPAPR